MTQTYTSAKEIEAALADRFCGPEWAFFPQLREGTGSYATRTADAVAMGLYPSRGMPLWGFEIKVTRGDLARELKDPDKAEDIAKYCDAWWIAVPKGLCTADELPATWGLIEIHEGSAKIKKQAAKMDPKPLPRIMVASIMRKVQTSYVPKSLVNDRVAREVAEKMTLQAKHQSFEAEMMTKKMDVFHQLEKLSGITIRDWNVERLAAVLKAVGYGEADPDYHINRLEELTKTAQNVALYLTRTIEELRGVKEATESSGRDPVQV